MKVASTKEAVDSGDYDTARVSEGLCYLVVCHRIGIDHQQAIDRSGMIAGTTLGWTYQERDKLPESWWEGDGAVQASPTDDGRDAPYPQPCAQHPETHVHVLAAC